CSIRGEPDTIEVVMPVKVAMNAGTGPPGSTSVWNSPSTCPPRTLTAPISVIAEVSGVPPVVSRSTTTKVTSAKGVPTSSRVSWTPAPGAPPGPGAGVAGPRGVAAGGAAGPGRGMARTLGPGADR